VSTQQILQLAIAKAKSGDKIEARDLLLQVVEENPRNEMAWMWLIGLVDSREDKIIACQNVLDINPSNDKVRSYLLNLERKQLALNAKKETTDARQLLKQAKARLHQKDKENALSYAMQAVEKDEKLEEAWLVIGYAATEVHQQIRAFEKALQLNPHHKETLVALENARNRKDDPLDYAVQLERLGKVDDALQLYNELAAKTQDLKTFDHIYQQISRLERLKKEKIQYVAPTSAIWRLTFTWPLLYFFLVFVQVGLNPFAHQAILLWMGLPWVFAGSFLLSISEVRFHHPIWRKVFGERGDGSSFARTMTAAAGWLMVIFPHLILLLDSLNRLRTFVIPPEPF
jgi:tetratricopeptide (TPR) repeat protein